MGNHSYHLVVEAGEEEVAVRSWRQGEGEAHSHQGSVAVAEVGRGIHRGTLEVEADHRRWGAGERMKVLVH